MGANVARSLFKTRDANKMMAMHEIILRILWPTGVVNNYMGTHSIIKSAFERAKDNFGTPNSMTISYDLFMQIIDGDNR